VGRRSLLDAVLTAASARECGRGTGRPALDAPDRAPSVSDRQADRRWTSPVTARSGFYKSGLNDGGDRPAAREARPTTTPARPTSPPCSCGSH